MKVTNKQIAYMFQISTQAVTLWQKNSELPHTKYNDGSILSDYDQVVRWAREEGKDILFPLRF